MEQNIEDEVAMKLFGKKAKDLKWVMFTNYVHKNLIENEELLRTGLYAWIPTFGGEVRQFQEVDPSEYSKYDIIQVNMSNQDMHIPITVRDVIGYDSKTKIIANNDYTCELWSQSFDYPDAWKHYYDAADMIFGTEPYQVGALEVLLNRKVHLITHPCFVRRLKTLRPKKTTNIISVMSHRYDMNVMVPSIAVNYIPGTEIRLIGYDVGSDRKRFVTSCCYKKVLPATNYMEVCEQMQESLLVVDPFTLTSQSRTGWDCAAMGVPMVGSDRNYSARICYPFTICDPYDVKKMKELTLKLINDKDFRKKVTDYAQNAVEMVSYENSKKRYLEKLGEGSPKL
jgi:hypothetical protein